MRPFLREPRRAPLELLRERRESVAVVVCDRAPHFLVDFLNIRVHFLCALYALFKFRPRLPVGGKPPAPLPERPGQSLRYRRLQVSHESNPFANSVHLYDLLLIFALFPV